MYIKLMSGVDVPIDVSMHVIYLYIYIRCTQCDVCHVHGNSSPCTGMNIHCHVCSVRQLDTSSTESTAV